MKKINYYLDENNVILGWHEIPFDETQPYLEIEDNIKPFLGYSQVINGELVLNEEAYLEAQAEIQLRWAKKERIEELKILLAALDYKTNKYVEGLLTEEEWAQVKAQRKAYRDEIEELEKPQE